MGIALASDEADPAEILQSIVDGGDADPWESVEHFLGGEARGSADFVQCFLERLRQRDASFATLGASHHI